MTANDVRRACGALYALRPDWVKGTISLQDAHYLYERVTVAPPGTLVEIGTASGISTAVICTALEASDAHRESTVVTYDLSPSFYAAPEHRTGDAARVVLPPDALGRITS